VRQWFGYSQNRVRGDGRENSVTILANPLCFCPYVFKTLIVQFYASSHQSSYYPRIKWQHRNRFCLTISKTVKLRGEVQRPLSLRSFSKFCSCDTYLAKYV
jgi:hypothetical protein